MLGVGITGERTMMCKRSTWFSDARLGSAHARNDRRNRQFQAVNMIIALLPRSKDEINNKSFLRESTELESDS